MLKQLFGLFIFFSTFSATAQYDQFGIIYPTPANKEGYGYTLFPLKATLNVYDTPGGKVAGKIVRPATKPGEYEDSYTLFYVNVQGDSTQIDFWGDMKEVGYEVAAFNYTARKDGYVKVLASLGGRWINTEDLTSLNFEALSYQEYMTLKSGKVLGFYPETSLNLRNGPTASSEKIETLTSLHEISLTGEHQGAWSKVKVIKLKEGRCGGGPDDEEYELEGWIKIIDKEGVLNAWYYTRGC